MIVSGVAGLNVPEVLRQLLKNVDAAKAKRTRRGLTMSATNPLLKAKRVIVKIGSALLVDQDTGQMRRQWLDALADDLALLRSKGAEVIVVSSGAIAVGRTHLKLPAGPLPLEEKQAAAATGQIRLAHAYQETLARHDITVAQVLLTLGRQRGSAALSQRLLDLARVAAAGRHSGDQRERHGGDRPRSASATTTGWPPAWRR